MVKFKINNQDWSIGFVENSDDMDTMCGFTSFMYGSILINENMTPSMTLSTVIHEVTHAYRWSYGFVDDVETQSIPTALLEEKIANFVEHYAKEIIEVSNKLYEKLEKERNV